jgi:hypothetical protein
MTSLFDVVDRQFSPMLAMLREILNACPDDVWFRPDLGVREHVYHVLIGMDIWLCSDPTAYPFDQIVDDGAAQLMGSASAEISRPFLLECLERVEARVAALPTSDADFLTSQRLGASEFTLLDRCIGQFRHTQHHIGMIHEKLANSGTTAADWLGYGEG